ncbi:MAG: S8 family serine peptidase [Rhodobiaceae bacterium]|nr:S8 family serine peptidase [Rhodobiaceae bacterium]
MRALLLIAFVSIGFVLSGAAQAQQQPEILDARELIVLTRPPEAPLVEQARALGYSLTATDPLDQLDDVLVTLRIPEGRTIPEAIAEIEAAVPGVTAGAHHIYRLQAGSAGGADRTYANALIGWPAEGCRAGRPIGMLDAGVLPGHPGLADGRIVEQRFVDGDAPPATDHGSLMADLLIGHGRLTGTTLYSANVVAPGRDGGDTAGVSSILKAVNWLRAQGVDLINVSLAGPRNKLLNRGLGTAADRGVVIVAAAGNLGPSAPPQFPAAFPFVLAVTAVDRDLDVYDRAIRGDHVDVSGPGVDILVEDGGKLRVLSGTSAAAPFVTAAIAADPSLRGEGAEAIRAKLAALTKDLGATGRDPVFGAGLILAPQNCRALK